MFEVVSEVREMGNRFTNRKNYGMENYLSRSVKMNNVLTDDFIGALALGAYALGETEDEKDLAMWIASHDQYGAGLGTVGFDISDIPWSVDNFEAEMKFMLGVIDAAKSAKFFESNFYLYQNGGFLDKFRELLADFSVEFIKPEKNDEWQQIKPERQKCPAHDVYLNWAGCIICHNGQMP
jgi:hypothetical protein